MKANTNPASGGDSSTSQDTDVAISPDSTGKKVDALSITRDDGTANPTNATTNTPTNETVIRQVMVLGGDSNTDRAEVTATKARRDAAALTVRLVDIQQLNQRLDHLADQNDRIIALLEDIAGGGRL